MSATLLPGIVAPDTPDMPAGIAAGKAASAIVLVRQRNQDLRTGLYRALMHGVGIVDGEVNGLRLAPADLVGLGEQGAVGGVGANRAEHDHAVAEGELGVGDRVVLAVDDQVPLEAEDGAQPVDGSVGVAVAQAGDNGGNRVLRRRRHQRLR